MELNACVDLPTTGSLGMVLKGCVLDMSETWYYTFTMLHSYNTTLAPALCTCSYSVRTYTVLLLYSLYTVLLLY
jgi:hypothetical protein